MNIEKSTVTKLVITGVPALDPITVFLEDIEPRRGNITIGCYGKAWSSYWGGMGDQTIAQFFCSCDEHYIAKNLAPELRGDVFNADAVKDHAKREILKRRRADGLSQDDAREQFDEIEFAVIDDDAWSRSNTELLFNIYGDEWWNRLPTKPNPDYQYLCRIINAVQEALKSEVSA